VGRPRKFASTDLNIWLNLGIFTPDDKEEIDERIRTETGLSVDSKVEHYYSEGSPVIPEVVVYVLAATLPLGDIYANVLASVLWDAVKAASTRQGRKDSKTTFTFSKIDKEGRVLHAVSGRTDDPEVIKELIHAMTENKSGPSLADLFRQMGEVNDDSP
jgi:hypothetical protein